LGAGYPSPPFSPCSREPGSGHSRRQREKHWSYELEAHARTHRGGCRQERLLTQNQAPVTRGQASASSRGSCFFGLSLPTVQGKVMVTRASRTPLTWRSDERFTHLWQRPKSVTFVSARVLSPCRDQQFTPFPSELLIALNYLTDMS
jgi:hypothetical protein